MKIRVLEILEVSIPLRSELSASMRAGGATESVIVRAETDAGAAGFGECAPRALVGGETPASVREAIAGTLAPRFLGARFGTFEEVVRALEEGGSRLPREAHAAYCALELAVLDAAGKAFGCSAGAVLGPAVVNEAVYSAVLPFVPPEEVGKAGEWIRAQGFRRVKVMVGLDSHRDVDVLSQLRDLLGADCALSIDAAGAWSAEEALRQVESFARFGITAVEQPVAPGDIEGLAWVTARSPLPVIADESVVTLQDAELLADRGACHGYSIRVSRCGGLLSAARLRDLAGRRGIGFGVGAYARETGILAAAGRHLATRSPGVLFSEGSCGRLFLEQDIVEPEVDLGPGGTGTALLGRGLGVDVDETRLAPFVFAHIRLESALRPKPADVHR